MDGHADSGRRIREKVHALLIGQRQSHVSRVSPKRFNRVKYGRVKPTQRRETKASFECGEVGHLA